MGNYKVRLEETQDISAWNNFRSLCFVLDDLKCEVEHLVAVVKEQEKRIVLLDKGLQSALVEVKCNHVSGVELPRWMRSRVHGSEDNFV